MIKSIIAISSLWLETIQASTLRKFSVIAIIYVNAIRNRATMKFLIFWFLLRFYTIIAPLG